MAKKVPVSSAKQDFKGKLDVVQKLILEGKKKVNVSWKITTLYRAWRKCTKTEYELLTTSQMIVLLLTWVEQDASDYIEEARQPEVKKKKKKKKDEKSFYFSWEWRELRYKILLKFGAVCMVCGATKADDVICVDHIKPRSKYPELELDEDNLQVLCGTCNQGKSNKDETDHRPKSKCV